MEEGGKDGSVVRTIIKTPRLGTKEAFTSSTVGLAPDEHE